MKRLTTIFTIFLVCINIIYTVQAQEKITVFIDGQEIQFDVDPVEVDGRTLVPFRKIFEIYNFNVNWTQSTQTVLASKESTILVLQINNKKAFMNNNSFQLDVPPQLIHDRTMVPLRFISENIGLNVEWVEATNSVHITSNK